ncbi:glycosyltransferase [Terriglobus sp. ADX1]|uniref:glycosyltransferase n=1 Tax=Terriglobus sp. ADX1 TaxID=2794063 RepID=UPI002FE630E6
MKPASSQSRSVMFIIDQLTELGGAERMMFALARSLPERGYKVAVVTLRDNPSPEAYKLVDEITVLPTRSCLSAQGLQTLSRLREMIRERNVCLVQTYFESADLFGAIASRLAGVTTICSSRRDMGILRTAKHNLLYRLLTPLYSHVFAVSEKVARWHREKDRITSGKISIVHNGVALERYELSPHASELRHAHGIPSDAFLVTTIANINPWKGVDVFIKAASIVHQHNPKAMFAIAGDWTDREHLQQLRDLVTESNLEGCVRFLGRVEDIPGLLHDSDVFALLSRTEGFPNVVIEAMAARLPVVATDVGGTSEAVSDGVTGYLVPNEDYQAAADHIVALMNDRTHRSYMGNAARELVESRFSIQAMVSQHVEVYDALLAT